MLSSILESKPIMIGAFFVILTLYLIISAILKAKQMKKQMDEVFGLVAMQGGFQEVTGDHREKTMLEDAIRSVHSNPNFTYHPQVKKALKKEVAGKTIYFTLMNLGMSSNRSSADNSYDNLCFLTFTSYKLPNSIYIRPIMTGMLENLYKMVFASVPALSGFDSVMEQKFTTYLFYMNRNEALSVLHSGVRFVLMKYADRYPFSPNKFATPSVVFGNGILCITGERIFTREAINDLLTLGTELAEEIEKGEWKEQFQNQPE